MSRSMKTGLDEADTRYGKMLFFRNDSGALSSSLKEYGEWADNELTFVRRFVSHGSVVVDVGAYIGTHTLAFSEFVGNKGQVFAIEAQPASYEVLVTNIEANNLWNVVPYNAIASNNIGNVIIPTIDTELVSSFGSASLHDILLYETEQKKISTQESEKIKARSISVDSLNLPSCDLIKIDVEGVEDMVLDGARETVGKYAPAIYCECNSIEDGLRSVAVLRSFGYSVYAHVVKAFNEKNFRGKLNNIFGTACEVALVGVPPAKEDVLHSVPPRDIELVLKICTADDLALALLNKPQYPAEILCQSEAAISGGSVFLDRIVKQRMDIDRANTEIYSLHKIVEEKDSNISLLKEKLSRISIQVSLMTEQAGIARKIANKSVSKNIHIDGHKSK